jgi:hypothetical protein
MYHNPDQEFLELDQLRMPQMKLRKTTWNYRGIFLDLFQIFDIKSKYFSFFESRRKDKSN